jgi:hypothetical protein
VLIVSSIPIAIEIVCTTTVALVTRLEGMNMLCSDKTGTLTLNKMVVQDETPTYDPTGLSIRYCGMRPSGTTPPQRCTGHPRAGPGGHAELRARGAARVHAISEALGGL